MLENPVEVPKQPSEMSFQELADRISEGKEFGTVTFNTMLDKGVKHWDELAKAGGPNSELFARLSGRYAQALYGGNADRTNFCLEEAAYLVKLAEEVESNGGKPEQVQSLKDRATNWQRMTTGFTLTGLD